jgi:uncharacterized membrane protein YhaH (DUF805 family)
MNWFLEALGKYAVFSGRARRAEYWFYWLFGCIFGILFGFVDSQMSALRGADPETTLPVLSLVYSLATILPTLAVLVRRLHDTNRSGFWVFIAFLPIIGLLILFVITVLGGTKGPNNYGPDPRA